MTELEGQLTEALRALSEQFEREQTRLVEQFEQQTERAEVLQRQVQRLEGAVTRLSEDYRSLAETLDGYWS